ncbi:hypothetical protein [Lysinibacillus sp. OF-1]|nr:hypothetical protein [Lysinibacillus sp. OF-1]WCH49730.1 hypothetical protein NV349_10240 [Lysinibacillus sp. OF-1]
MSKCSSNSYDLKLVAIDEQIYALLQQRKEVCSHTPDFPSDEIISEWAQQYGFDHTFLAMFFHLMRREKYYNPKVEPAGFRHYIPVLQTVEKGGRLYTLSSIRQYENASIVQLLVDWDEQQEPEQTIQLIDESYECQIRGTRGSNGHESSTFIVTPPLPEDIQGFDFVFTQYEDVFEEKPTGWAVTIHG